MRTITKVQMKAKSNEKKKKPRYATAVSNKHERIDKRRPKCGKKSSS